MNHFVNAPVWAMVLAASVLAGNAHAAASSNDSPGAAEAAKLKKKTHGSSPVRFLPGSAETVQERNSRLRRECKGQVNAGACTGHTG